MTISTRHLDDSSCENTLKFKSYKLKNKSSLAKATTMTYFSFFEFQGIARTQSPTTRNYALDLPTFEVIAGVNPTEVQWKGSASLITDSPVPGKYAFLCLVTLSIGLLPVK